MLQTARGIVVEKVFQPAKVSTSSRKRFSTSSRLLAQLENLFDDKSSTWLKQCLVGEPFLRRLFELVATFACWKTFRQVLELFVTLAGWKLSDERGLEPVGICLETFSTRLQPARWFHVEKVFQAAKVAISLKTHGRKGFPASWRTLELVGTLACWKTFWLEPFRRTSPRGVVVEKVFKLANVATSSRNPRWKSFPTS